MIGGGIVTTQPAFAAGCELKAFAPYKSGGSVASSGGRTGCGTSVSTTVAVKGVRGGGLPDSVLAKSSKNTGSQTWTVYFGNPTSGYEYRTQTWTSSETKQSGTLVW